MINEIDLLKKLVNIKSDPLISNKDIITFLSELFVKYPQSIIAQEKNDLKLYNLIVTIPPKYNSENVYIPNNSLRPIIFLMHSDTVEGKWFENAIETDKEIIGLGSCDMKAGIASVCSAVLEEEYSRPITLVFSSDEETTGKGARLINEKLDIENNIIIVAEPTSRKINNSQNSCISYEVTTEGKRQHASLDINFNNENSAIMKMIRICNYLIDYPKIDTDISSQNIGRINGGASPNIVADNCTMAFEQRFLPGTDIDKKIDYIKLQLENRYASDVKISFYGEDFNSTNEKMKKGIGEIVSRYFKPEFEKMTAWTEAGIFSKKGECVIFGPGNISLAHTKNEYVNKDEVKIFKKIYSDFIKELY